METTKSDHLEEEGTELVLDTGRKNVRTGKPEDRPSEARTSRKQKPEERMGHGDAGEGRTQV